MRILYFHQHFNTPQGTVGVRSYKMARALVDAGHRVTMVCGSYRGGVTGLAGPFLAGRRSGAVDGIDVIELELPYANADGLVRRAWVFAKFSLRSAVIALSHPCDLVFATSTPLTAAIPGIIAKWLRRKPFVFEVRDLWPELPKAMGVVRNPIVLGAMSLLEGAAYRSADRLVALAGGIAAGMVRRGTATDKIAIIPNGCDMDIFGATAAAAPWPAGISQDDLIAIYAGTHGVANGLGAVLDAAAELQRRARDDIKIVMIGDGKVKPGLQARVARENLRNVFLLDPVPKTTLASMMSSAGLGLQILDNVPAFYEGTSPNKFFDYLSAGKPVLVNYPGWVAELVRAESCGFAIPPEDPAAFADALETAAADRQALGRMGAAAKALASREFDREHLARRFVAWITNGTRREAGA